MESIFRTGADARKVVFEELLESNKVTPTKPNNSPFRDRYHSFLELERLGYAPVMLDKYGKPSKIFGQTLAITHAGLTIVTSHDGMTAEAVENPAWSWAPCFADPHGAVAWLFAGIGDHSVDDLLGYRVESRIAASPGFQSMEAFLAVPPEGLVWIREPNIYKRKLPPLPTALRNELIFQAEHNV